MKSGSGEINRLKLIFYIYSQIIRVVLLLEIPDRWFNYTKKILLFIQEMIP